MLKKERNVSPVNKLLTPDLVDLRAKFMQTGFDIRFVGGCVRDVLYGTNPKDIDLCTDASPFEQVEIYKANNIRYIETGLQHGTITIVINDVTYEITSLRTDVSCNGRHAEVAFTKNWEDDLARRDFTMNAMSLDFDGNLIDPFNGYNDLKNRSVRFVGDPTERIKEDYLRILRWYRFRGRFDDTAPDLNSFEAVNDEAGGLFNISRERVWSEFSKIISGNNGPNVVEMMHRDRVVEFCNLYQTIIDVHHCADVHRITKNPVTLMVAMYGYQAISALKSWKASSDEIKLAAWLHEATGMDKTPRWFIAVQNVKREWVLELTAIKLMDEFERSIIAEWVSPEFPVNGFDLIKLGIKPGRQYSQIIDDLKNKWADSTYTMNKEDLLATVDKSLFSMIFNQ